MIQILLFIIIFILVCKKENIEGLKQGPDNCCGGITRRYYQGMSTAPPHIEKCFKNPSKWASQSECTLDDEEFCCPMPQFGDDLEQSKRDEWFTPHPKNKKRERYWKYVRGKDEDFKGECNPTKDGGYCSYRSSTHPNDRTAKTYRYQDHKVEQDINLDSDGAERIYFDRENIHKSYRELEDTYAKINPWGEQTNRLDDIAYGRRGARKPKFQSRRRPDAPHSDPHGGTSSLPIEEQIIEIYRLHNPSALPKIPALLEKYRGREKEILFAARKKYETETAAETAAEPEPAPAAAAEPATEEASEDEEDEGDEWWRFWE